MAILVNGSVEKLKLAQFVRLMKWIMTSFIQVLTRGKYYLPIHKR